MTHQFPWLGRPQKVNMLQVTSRSLCQRPQHAAAPVETVGARVKRWTEPCFQRSLPGILSQWCTQCWRSAQKGQVPRLMRPQVTLSESVRFSKAMRCDTRHLRRALFLGSLLELPGWLFKGLTAGRCLVDGCFRHCAGPQQILSCGRYCQQPRIRVLVLIVRLEFSQIVQTPNILGSDALTCIGSSFIDELIVP